MRGHNNSVDTGLLKDYGGSQRRPGSIIELKCPSDDSSNNVPVVAHEESRNSKHDSRAVLVPIKNGTELGYFSTMSANLYTGNVVELTLTNSNLILNKIVGTGIFVRSVCGVSFCALSS